MTGLVDLDELALRCRDEQARQYIHEAVACYKAGAFRSCIVATWNAVVFDFLHKLRELDLTGDNRSRIKLAEFENIRAGGESRLKEALDFERSVLDVAAKLFLNKNVKKNHVFRFGLNHGKCLCQLIKSLMNGLISSFDLRRLLHQFFCLSFPRY